MKATSLREQKNHMDPPVTPEDQPPKPLDWQKARYAIHTAFKELALQVLDDDNASISEKLSRLKAHMEAERDALASIDKDRDKYKPPQSTTEAICRLKSGRYIPESVRRDFVRRLKSPR